MTIFSCIDNIISGCSIFAQREIERDRIYIYISCTRHNPNSSLHRYLFPRISLSEACNMKTYKYVTSFSAYEL